MSINHKYSSTVLALFTSAFLFGCGGGGGGGTAAAPAVPVGPVTSTLTFPYLQAQKAGVAAGHNQSFVVSGSCTGTATSTQAPATTPAVFEANPAALSAFATLTATLTNATGITGCPPTLAQTVTSYFDSNYTPLGYNQIGFNYGVYLIPPIIPVSVTVGSTGVIGTETLYTDASKTIFNGRNDISYVVEADTASTAIVNIITMNYNSANTLITTAQGRSRISATGTKTPISLEITDNKGIHLIFK